MNTDNLSAEEVAQLLKDGALLIDVRTKLEVMMGIAPGAMHISLFSLKRHLCELPHDREIVVYCRTGGRAAKAKQVLEAAGFKAFNGGGYKDIVKIVADNVDQESEQS